VPCAATHTLPAELLVEHDELEVRHMTEQLVLELADDPRDARLRPRVLQRPHDRQYWQTSPIAESAARKARQGVSRGAAWLTSVRCETVGSGGGIVNNPPR
jgi:hypothetical protein